MARGILWEVIYRVVTYVLLCGGAVHCRLSRGTDLWKEEGRASVWLQVKIYTGEYRYTGMNVKF